MQSKGLKVDGVMFNTLIDGFCNKGMIHEAYELLLVIGREGFGADLSVSNKIFMELCKLNQEREVKRLFNIMVKRGAAPNLASFTYLVDVSSK